MNGRWVPAKLGEICEFAGGSQPPKSEFSFEERPGYVRFLQIRDFGSDKHVTFVPNSPQNRLCREEDILIGRYGASVGKILTGKAGAYNVALMKAVPDVTVVTRAWLYHYLLSSEFQSRLQQVAARSAQAGFSREDIMGFPVPVPPMPEQRRIVGVLDRAFAAIATAKTKAEKNLQNARAVFEAHLEETFGGGSGGVIKALGEVCEFVGGSQPPKSTFSKTEATDKVRLIQIRDYKSDKHRVFIPRSEARRLCNADDVMIGRYGPPLFQILRGLNGAYNVALMKAVPDEGRLSRDYLYYFLRNGKIRRYVIGLSSRAAGQSGLNKETLEPYPIALPPLAGQADIVKSTRALEGECRCIQSVYERKIAALDELKKSLLHEAFNGRL